MLVSFLFMLIKVIAFLVVETCVIIAGFFVLLELIDRAIKGEFGPYWEATVIEIASAVLVDWKDRLWNEEREL